MLHAPRSTRRPLFLLGLGLVFLIAQFRDILHQAEARHVRCAAHGEWIHVGESAGVAAAHADHPLPRGPEISSTRTANESHEHCDSPFSRRERPLAWNVRPIVARPSPPLVATLVHARAPQPDSIARYRLAPKQSPPCS